MTERTQDILRVLCNSVRVLSVRQIAGGWWSDTRWGRSRAEAALHDLAGQELVRVRRALARPIAALTSPLITWNHGDATPDWHALASQLHRRAMKPASLMTIVFATRTSVSLFSRNRMSIVKLTQMTHDLYVAEVFLHYRRRGLANAWISEDSLPKDWAIKERPDALLCDPCGAIIRAVEYGGDYPAARLAGLHDGLASAGLSYEIW